MRTSDGASVDGEAVFESIEHVVFRDHSYRWVDLSRFRLTGAGPLNPTEALSMLLRSADHYVNRYFVADDHPNFPSLGREPGPETHGPYLMSAINVDAFDQRDGSAARRALLEWIGDKPGDYPSAAQIEGDLDAILDHLGRAVTAFELRNLGDEAQHAIWYLTDPFIELITVDLWGRTIGLVAGGGD